MKKIGIISDTHIPRSATVLPGEIERVFSGVDMILHAGDLESLSVLDTLELIAPVASVRGNMDSGQNTNPVKRVVEFENCRIGLIHGWGAPHDLHFRVMNEFKDKLDCIVFGHSHSPFNETVSGILMFNPGSPTDKRFAPFRSVGLLTVEEKAVHGEIIKL